MLLKTITLALGATLFLTLPAAANGNSQRYRSGVIVERPKPLIAVGVFGGAVALFDDPLDLMVDLDRLGDNHQVRVRIRDLFEDETPRRRKRVK